MIATVALFGVALMALAFLAIGVWRHDRTDAALGVGMALTFTVYYAMGRALTGWALIVVGALELLAVLLVGVLLMDTVGAPLPLVRRIPILRRRAQWRFDGALHRQLVRFWALSDAPASPIEIRDISGEMRRLRAPDIGWADLRDGYAAALDAQADYIERGERDRSREAGFQTQLEQLAERCGSLRAAYEAGPKW